MQNNVLFYSAFDANLIYETNFEIHDPVFFVKKGKEKYLLLNKLEFERARKLNCANLIRFEDIQDSIDKTKKRNETEIALQLLKRLKISSACVPPYFPVELFLNLKKRGIKLTVDKTIGEEREIKSEKEYKKIELVQTIAENGIKLGVDILKKSTINGNFLYFEGKKLTSEFLKAEITGFLVENKSSCVDMIISSAKQSAIPHLRGSGPIYRDRPIIFDIFPQSHESFYFGDLTRTFVKGRPSEKIKKMFKAVKESQEIAFSKIKEGVLASDVHSSVEEYFKEAGFPPHDKNGVSQGFIHGTGHGVGLEVHEKPRISKNDYRLKAGNVITIEPGLYYSDVGGVRIEDVIVVTKDGYKNLTKLPKFLGIE